MFSESAVDVQISVENSRMASHMATMEMNLTIFDVSCLLINPMITSDVDSSIESIEEVFQKTRIYNNGSGIEYVMEDELTLMLESAENEKEIKQSMKDFMVKGESCNLYAKLPVPKILGSVTFATMINPQILIIASDLGLNYEMKSHKLHSLRFKNGAESFLTEEDPLFMEDFDEDDIESLDRIKDINQEPYINSKKPSHVMYFIQVIPHIIYDQFSGKDLYSYSYSVNHNSRSNNEASGVSILYDFSPLTMRVTKRNQSLGKLAIDI